jgi:hypothetical protein
MFMNSERYNNVLQNQLKKTIQTTHQVMLSSGVCFSSVIHKGDSGLKFVCVMPSAIFTRSGIQRFHHLAPKGSL